MEETKTPETPAKKKLMINLITFGVTIAILVGAFLILKGYISKAEYEQIKMGMTYEEVCDIIGGEGECSVSSGVGSYSGQVYTWKGTLYFINGSNAAITFMNGRVTAMASVGLI
ncbi:MAG: hypothetical protein IJV82_04880 [Oscillospiraceae bacterium]|nr:hypothetical protein [Oscillospiraceae bacterium]